MRGNRRNMRSMGKFSGSNVRRSGSVRRQAYSPAMQGMANRQSMLSRRGFVGGVAAGVAGAALGASGLVHAQTPPSVGNMWMVAQDGTGDFLTIQEAVDAAAPGDTIMVMPGDYKGADINKPLEIIGSTDARITQGKHSHGSIFKSAFFVGASDVKIQGFTIVCPDHSTFGWGQLRGAVRIAGVSNATISNLNVIGKSMFCIVNYGSGCKITHNTINDFMDCAGLAGLPFNHPFKMWNFAIYTSSSVNNNNAISEDNLIAFNEIYGDCTGYGGNIYKGIMLEAGSALVPEKRLCNNKVIKNMTYIFGGPNCAGITLGDYYWRDQGIRAATLNKVVANDAQGSDIPILIAPDETVFDYNTIEANIGYDVFPPGLIDPDPGDFETELENAQEQ
jgi:hypothetical protein